MFPLPVLFHIVFSCVFLSIISPVSCAADNSAALLHELKAGHYDFFLKADNAAYRSIKKMGRGSGYYVGMRLKRAGYSSAARFYFALGEKLYEAPFNVLCRERLYETGAPADCLASVQARLKQLEKQNDPEAQTEQERLNSMRLRLLLQLKAYTEITAAPDQLYLTGAITQPLAEAFPELGPALTPVNQSLAACRISVFEKRYQEAWAAAQNAFMMEETPAALASARLLSDIGRAGVYGAADSVAAAAFFESLAANIQKEPAAQRFTPAEKRRILFYTSFYAARCRARVGKADQREQAAQLFLGAADTADTAADIDSALWYYLDTLRMLSKRRYLAALAETVPRWNNPRWYADLVQALRIQLTAAQDWETLRQLYALLAKISLPEERAALTYTLARSGALASGDAARFLQEAAHGSAALPYYRIMTAYRQGKDIAAAAGILRSSTAGTQAAPATSRASTTRFSAPESAVGGNAAGTLPASGQIPGQTAQGGGCPAGSAQNQPDRMLVQDAHVYISGLLHFGLYSLVYPQVTAVYPSIPTEEAVQIASVLQAEGFYADSIRLVSFSLRNQEEAASEAQLRLLYPQLHRELVAKYAATYQLPEYLLYALIRSESFFQPEIVSGAGAVGLTQLMPATAADIAKKLKVADYSLTDPETNIRFGAYYLAEMIRRLDNRVMPACFAYNAGISRVRSWQQRSRGLPDDLFLESLDYAETRDYGRKILSAAVVYGALYYDEKPEDIVRLFFP